MSSFEFVGEDHEISRVRSFKELKAEFDHKKGVNRSGGPISDEALRLLAEEVVAAYEREALPIAKRMGRKFRPLNIHSLLH